jgi:hypothetical protein
MGFSLENFHTTISLINPISIQSINLKLSALLLRVKLFIGSEFFNSKLLSRFLHWNKSIPKLLAVYHSLVFHIHSQITFIHFDFKNFIKLRKYLI